MKHKIKGLDLIAKHPITKEVIEEFRVVWINSKADGVINERDTDKQLLELSVRIKND
jgi:hypothetical protein